MKSVSCTSAASATCEAIGLRPPHSYSGSGKIECLHGSCRFFINPKEDSDHTETYVISNAFRFASTGARRRSGKTKLDPSHELCYFKEATETGTDDWWKYWDLQIDESCSFSTNLYQGERVFNGPGLLECTEGACYNFSPFDDCGTEIYHASQDWGEVTLLRYSSEDEDVVPAQVFSGFNAITTTDVIKIDEGCSLQCSGCHFTRYSETPQKKNK